MFSPQRSLRRNFLVKLAAVTAGLELLFSFVFYHYISYSVDQQLKTTMIKQANYLFGTYDDLERVLATQKSILKKTLKLQARIETLPDRDFQPVHFKTFKRHRHAYLEAYFPYEFASQRYLILTADVTSQKAIENQVIRGIILFYLLGMAGVMLYAFFLSGMLVAPVRVFAHRLSKVNERALAPMALRNVPEEFLPLGRSINQLIGRIESFLRYKKELFVGTAHELKTPLAVIKAESQVALMKRTQTVEGLSEVLKNNIRTVDAMNRVIESILAFGRAEGAQFEEPETIDVVAFLKGICQEFTLLAEQTSRQLQCRFAVEHLSVTLPPLLLRQIVQNLLQNALKFTPEGKRVKMIVFRKDTTLRVMIRDEGKGIEEGLDVFAPFRRTSDSSGAGLGLFLVKSAADALGAEVTLKNRIDARGAVATLVLPLGQDP